MIARWKILALLSTEACSNQNSKITIEDWPLLILSQVLFHTLKASSYELSLLLLMLLIPVVIFSSIVYAVESSLDETGKFDSIPRTFWWCIITMTTVRFFFIIFHIFSFIFLLFLFPPPLCLNWLFRFSESSYKVPIQRLYRCDPTSGRRFSSIILA